MRLIIAILRPAQVEGVRQALADIHVTRMTVCDAHGYDASPGTDRGRELSQEAVMEIACNDDFVERAVGTIAAALAVTGEVAACRLLVLPMLEAVQIYRDVRGPEAI